MDFIEHKATQKFYAASALLLSKFGRQSRFQLYPVQQLKRNIRFESLEYSLGLQTRRIVASVKITLLNYII